MEQYQEIRIARRGLRLVQDSGMNFSVLNTMFIIGLIAVVIVAVGSILHG